MESWEVGKWVGWDDKMSARGVNFMNTNRNDKPEYITCSEGDGRSAVNIMVNQTKEAVVACETLINGCYECSASESKT